MTLCAQPVVNSIVQNPYAKMSLVIIQAAPAKTLVNCKLLIASPLTPAVPPATSNAPVKTAKITGDETAIVQFAAIINPAPLPAKHPFIALSQIVNWCAKDRPVRKVLSKIRQNRTTAGAEL